MRLQYSDSPGLYNDYYAAQVGGGDALPYFAGAHVQRGHGIGDIFAGLLRSVVPTLKNRILPTVTRQVPKRLLGLGTDIVTDVVRGRNVGNAVKARGLQHLKRFTNDVQRDLFRPPGVPARKRARTTKAKPKRSVRHKKDIFA